MRRQRIDSAASASAVASAAAKPINPPPHVALDENDRPFFDSVVSECAKIEWTAHKLEFAALLARAMADFEREQRLMRSEGSVLETERGPVVNPRKSVVHMLEAAIIAMRRSLSLHGRAQDGEPRDAAKRRAMAKAIETGVLAGDNDLIPGRSIQ